MTVKEILAKLSGYKKNVLNFPEEELRQLDSSYKVLDFSGNPENIRQNSSGVIKKGLEITGNTIYFLLFANDNDRIDKVMKAIPMDEIRSLALHEKYGLYTLPTSEGILPITLLLIFK